MNLVLSRSWNYICSPPPPPLPMSQGINWFFSNCIFIVNYVALNNILTFILLCISIGIWFEVVCILGNWRIRIIIWLFLGCMCCHLSCISICICVCGCIFFLGGLTNKKIFMFLLIIVCMVICAWLYNNFCVTLLFDFSTWMVSLFPCLTQYAQISSQ